MTRATSGHRVLYPRSTAMRKAARRILLPPALYLCWLGMMAVHEAGHVLHAWVSGGTVSAVRVPLLGFSVTEFSDNPRPHFVAWGGAIWGCVLPLTLHGAWRALRLAGRAWVQFFAGFCLVANGAYLGVGWATKAGDAGDLLIHGTPVWGLIAFGVVATAGGFTCGTCWGCKAARHPGPLPRIRGRGGR